VVPSLVVGLVPPSSVPVPVPVLELLLPPVEPDLVLVPPLPVVVLELPVDFVVDERLPLPPTETALVDFDAEAPEPELRELPELLPPEEAFDLLVVDEAPPTLELPLDLVSELESSLLVPVSVAPGLVVDLRVLDVAPPALFVAAFPPLPSLGAASIGLLSTSPSLLLQAALSRHRYGIDSAHRALLRRILICYLSHRYGFGDALAVLEQLTVRVSATDGHRSLICVNRASSPR
jgi:hypothetical protein